MNAGIEKISSTSKTALITLYAHSLESQDENPVLVDEAAVRMTDALSPILAKSDSRLLRNLSQGKMRRALQVHIALRAKKYDEVAEDFIEKHPDGIVVNLGCGFDSRYYRLKKKPFLFIDLDLPEMISIKKGVFTETESYRLIGQSIFNRDWLEQLKSYDSPVLFLAEGLFMYLHPEELIPWLKETAEGFPGSELVFETVAEKYTRGFNKKMVEFKLRREIGVEGDVGYHFGLFNSRDLEKLSGHFQWIEDWSYFDDKNPKIHWMNWMGKVHYFKYVQWTVFYRIK
jgi:methyltransferase (TIGR00027 family)